MKKMANPKDLTLTKWPGDESGLTFESAQETKRIALKPGNSKKTASLGAHLDCK